MACLSLISGEVLEHELYHSLFCLETKGLNFYTTPISQPLATSHSPGEGVMTFLFPGTPIGSGQVPKERGSCELLLEVNTHSECGALEGTGSPSLEKESVGGIVIALPQRANGRGDSNPALHPGADSAGRAGFLQPCHLVTAGSS